MASFFVDRGFAIFRPLILPFFGDIDLDFTVFTTAFVRFRFPRADVVDFLDSATVWTFFTLLCTLVFVVLTFVRAVTMVALTTLPFLNCALTFFWETLVIRPSTTRFTFGLPVLPLPFLGELTVCGLGGGGNAFFLPINPRHVSAPHMHLCSFAFSNHEKL